MSCCAVKVVLMGHEIRGFYLLIPELTIPKLKIFPNLIVVIFYYFNLFFIRKILIIKFIWLTNCFIFKNNYLFKPYPPEMSGVMSKGIMEGERKGWANGCREAGEQLSSWAGGRRACWGKKRMYESEVPRTAPSGQDSHLFIYVKGRTKEGS